MTFKDLKIKMVPNNTLTFLAPCISSRVGLGILFLLISQFSFAQKKEQIGNETVNVVKPYTPKISDASKVKEVGELDDEGNTKKEVVKYTIFSFPVASTFTPSKGKAEGVEKEKQAHLFKNYATLGLGNYGTLIGELFVNHDLSNTDYVGGMFRHHSSQGGIKEARLDDRFYDTSLDLMYGSNQKDISWNLDLGMQNQIYNWYGLPVNFANTLSLDDRRSLINSIDPKQAYTTISLGGNVAFSDGIVNKVSLKYNHFTDIFNSSENRFFIKPTVAFDVMDSAVKTDFIVDYVGGSFEKNYLNNVQPLKYGFTNFGVSPSFVMLEQDWTLTIGAAIFYSLDNQNSNNKFLVYPKFNASYKVVGDLMIFYAGAEGDLKQNSYQDFVGVNPFLSPTLFVAPTDQQYDIFAGLKGKLSNNVSYNVRGSYTNERNKALFKSNIHDENPSNENYEYGNSFQVVYDDMRTLRFYGELKADFSDNVTFGVNGSFSSFKNASQNEAWNLPTVKVNSNLDFNITKKWFAGVNVFYVGERKDFTVIDFQPMYKEGIVTLKSYFDLNANLGYNYSDRLTGFIRANNITNSGYQKWQNYPVQGFQLVLGANYKFDF
ncbi:TonB-dependent receptor [Flavobacterium sp. GP15]|uniref:TonB-dependent receptor n=1 Tax=Flavobacterium sp. GP15 TaxID=2758567 RepID=UPI002102554F|nr:TonB-dependent receptor [Flavobacterium sp. GP15]